MEDEYLKTCRRRVTQAFANVEKIRKFRKEAIKLFGVNEPELIRKIDEVLAFYQRTLDDADHYLLDYVNKQADIEKGMHGHG